MYRYICQHLYIVCIFSSIPTVFTEFVHTSYQIDGKLKYHSLGVPMDIPKEQSTQSRLDRLLKGRCPVHDKPMMHIDCWDLAKGDTRYSKLMGCMDTTCKIEARSYNREYIDLKLTNKHQYLLEQVNGKGRLLILGGHK